MGSEKQESTIHEDSHIGSEIGLELIIAHLYRGEMDRTTSWRQRLDSTTNFAMTIMGAILAYAFAGQGAGHTTILIAMLVGLMFLLIEQTGTENTTVGGLACGRCRRTCLPTRSIQAVVQNNIIGAIS